MPMNRNILWIVISLILSLMLASYSSAAGYKATEVSGITKKSGGQASASTVKMTSKLPVDAHISDQIVIGYKSQITSADSQSIAATYNVKILKTSEFNNYQLVQIPEGKTVEEMTKVLSKDSRIAYAEPNYLMEIYGYNPNDPYVNDTTFIEGVSTGIDPNEIVWNYYYNDSTGHYREVHTYQDYLYRLGLLDLPGVESPLFNIYGVYSFTASGESSAGTAHLDIDPVFSVYSVTRGSSSVKVAVLDSGIDKDHEDLTGKIERTWNYVGTANDGDAPDTNGHGTQVAGVIAASGNNGKGVHGIAPNVRLIALKVMSGDTGSTYDIAEAITGAAERWGANIINMSFGATFSQFSPPSHMITALEKAKSAGCHLVAAMGNDSRDFSAPTSGNIPNGPWVFPAMYPGVIGVGSWNMRYNYSNDTVYEPIIPSYTNKGWRYVTPSYALMSAYTYGYDSVTWGMYTSTNNRLFNYGLLSVSGSIKFDAGDILGTDVMAPGGDADDHLIVSTYPYEAAASTATSDRYEGMQSTSMAAAQVSGMLGLLLSAKGTNLSRDYVRNVLYQSSLNPYSMVSNRPVTFGDYTTITGYGLPVPARMMENRVLVVDYIINDAPSVDGRVGNGDGLLNSSETVDIQLGVYNAIGADLIGTYGVLSSNDANVTVIQATGQYGTITSGSLAYNTTGYRISLASVSDPYTAKMTLYLHYMAGGDERIMAVPVEIPVSFNAGVSNLRLQSVEIIDDSYRGAVGNGDGRAEPGETVLVKLNVLNYGAPVSNAYAELSTVHPQANVYYSPAGLFSNGSTTIPLNAYAENSPYFQLKFNNYTYTTKQDVTLYITIYSESSAVTYSFTFTLYPKVGGIYHQLQTEKVNVEQLSRWNYGVNGYLGDYKTILSPSIYDNLDQNLTLSNPLINNTGFILTKASGAPLTSELYVHSALPHNIVYDSHYTGKLDAIKIYGPQTEYYSGYYISSTYSNATIYGMASLSANGGYTIFDDTTYRTTYDRITSAKDDEGVLISRDVIGQSYTYAMMETLITATAVQGFYGNEVYTPTGGVPITKKEWLDRFPIVFAHETSLSLDHFEIYDYRESGISNGLIEPGDSVKLKPFIRNNAPWGLAYSYMLAGDTTADPPTEDEVIDYPLMARLVVDDPYITVSVPTVMFDPTNVYNPSKQTFVTDGGAFEFTVSPGMPQNHKIYFEVQVLGIIDTSIPYPYLVTDTTNTDILKAVSEYTTFYCPGWLESGQLVVYDGTTSQAGTSLTDPLQFVDRMVSRTYWTNSNFGPNPKHLLSWNDGIAKNTTYLAYTTAIYNNGDGLINPGENISLNFSVWNRNFNDEVNGITAYLSTTDDGVYITDSTVRVGSLSGREIVRVNDAFGFYTHLDFLKPSIKFHITFKDTQGRSYDNSIDVPVKKSYPPQLPGFPVALDQRITSSPTIADFDSDGIVEAIIGQQSGKVSAYKITFPKFEMANDSTYSMVPNPVWQVSCGIPVNISPAVGDIDGSGSKAVVVVASDGNLYAWSTTGQSYGNSTGLLVNLRQSGNTLWTPPVLVDLDSSKPGLEIVAGGTYSDGATIKGQIFAFSSDGQPIGFFGSQWSRDGLLNGPVYVAPAIIEDDPADPKVVVASRLGEVIIYGKNGLMQHQYNIPGNITINAPPVIVDIDQDGSSDVVVKCSDGNIWAISGDGTLKNGFPVMTGGSVATPLAVYDSNFDGFPEIICGGTDAVSYVYYDALSTLAYSNEMPIYGFGKTNIVAQPAMVDMDRDEYTEMAVTDAEGALQAYQVAVSADPDNAGLVNSILNNIYATPTSFGFMNNSPAVVRLANPYSPSIGGDPMNHVVVVNGNKGNVGSVYAFLVQYDSDTANYFWPQFRRDERHTGLYMAPSVPLSNPNLQVIRTDVGLNVSGDAFSTGVKSKTLVPGDTVDLYVLLSNLGLGNAKSVEGVLSCSNSDITITKNSSAYGDVAPGAIVKNQEGFRVTLNSNMAIPSSGKVIFKLAVTFVNDKGQADSLSLNVVVPVSSQRTDETPVKNWELY